ncbi:MAG: cytochrome c [Psychromonas sp.]|nr:cytochrome c [Psychromonas sp.]
MKRLLIASLILYLPIIAIAAGKVKSEVCSTCHGSNGISIASIYPNLKGQKKAYIISSYKSYKNGERKGGMSALMAPQSKLLSDKDIVNVAAYYSSLK